MFLDPHAHLPQLTDRNLLVAILLGVVIVGWPSIRTLFALANGDTPLSFVPLVSVVGAAFVLRSFDGERLHSVERDRELDFLVLLLLIGMTFVVLGILPLVLSWDYSLGRLDIPGLVLLLATLVVAAWGLPALEQLGPALFYLLLAWPLPYLVVDNHLIPWLTAVTAHAVRALVPLLPGSIAADPADPSGLLITFHGQTASLVIAQACAGMNGALGLAVIGLPLALLGRGTWNARGIWLALGVLLSWLANVLRLLLVTVTAALLGPDIALNTLHPFLGLILFALSFALLLCIAPICRLDVAAPWRSRSRPSTGPGSTLDESLHRLSAVMPQRDAVQVPQPHRTMARSTATTAWRWSTWRLLLLGAILGAAALMENDLSHLYGISESTLPRMGLARADDLFHPPAGWHVADIEPMDWRNLFGSTSVAAVLDVTAPSRAAIGIQAIMARDSGGFAAYGIENCYVFHGYTLRGIHHVVLGHGVTAKIIDFTQQGHLAAALYWLQPVQTPQGLYHERIVLIDDDPTGHVARLQAPAHGSLLQRAVNAVLDLIASWGLSGGSNPAYSGMNSQLQSLAQAVVAQERQH